MKKLKPVTSITEQIDLLRSRGMSVEQDLAEQWLENVSYYRLSAYWFPARIVSSSGNRLEIFKADTSFSDVIALYEADRKLRTLIHDGIERIETTMRSRIANQMCPDDSSFYLDSAKFRPTFAHMLWVHTAQKRIARASKHNESIKHYREEYDGVFPFWVLAEVLDFADVSRLFDGLLASDQRTIAEGLGISIDLTALSANQQRKVKTNSPFARWLEQLTVVRNSCAHHSRLWNKSFTPAPTAALKTQDIFADLPEGQSERIFGALTVMSHLLRKTSPGTKWPRKIEQLLAEEFLSNPLVEPSSLGISEGWQGTFIE